MQTNLKNMFDLHGRLALVTGGCQNFGREIATGLAEMGADLIITSRQLDKAEHVAQELAAELKVSATGLALDLRDETSMVAAFQTVCDRFGRLDILVNNAGGHSPGVTGDLLTESLTAWNNFVEANLTGTFLCIREAAKLMQATGRGGSIINIGSVTSLLGRDRTVYLGTTMTPNPVPYTASKAGVVGLTYDAAASLGPLGIRVNVISPGGFQRTQPEPFIKAYAERTMLGRMGQPGDLKGAVAFLASDAAAYITGHNLYVDGGFSRFK